MKTVPFVDLSREYSALKTEINEAVTSVCDQGAFILGPEVRRFEEEFAKYTGAAFCVGVANGTDSLTLSYRALGIGPGDEVLIPAHTFVATAIGVLQAGATPVLVDIDPDTFLIDLGQAEARITKRTRAICPVHLYGRAVNMTAVRELATRHSLMVVEDAAQAHGAKWNGQRVGTFGEAGSFSFYPAKNLGAFGDGGAVTTSSSDTSAALRRLRNYGSEVKYEHPELGVNSRLDSLQAAILRVKLRHLDENNKKRWNAAKTYDERLNIDPKLLVKPALEDSASHVFHLYVIRIPNRDQVSARLKELGVHTVIHYPRPFYLEGGYKSLGYQRGDFPVTEKISQEILSLPLFPDIVEDEVNYVAEMLLKIIKT